MIETTYPNASKYLRQLKLRLKKMGQMFKLMQLKKKFQQRKKYSEEQQKKNQQVALGVVGENEKLRKEITSKNEKNSNHIRIVHNSFFILLLVQISKITQC